LRLFEAMQSDGLQPDKIAYNTVLNALRVAEKSDLAYELFLQMCDSKQPRSHPDIITVTNVIAALSTSEESRTKADRIFEYALERGILLNHLDSVFEVDLSGMSFPVARAACRYVVDRAVKAYTHDRSQLLDLSFITGVGAVACTSNRNSKRKLGNERKVGDADKQSKISLREYVQQVLREDFDPPIESLVPKRAEGTVQIDRSVLDDYMKKRQ